MHAVVYGFYSLHIYEWECVQIIFVQSLTVYQCERQQVLCNKSGLMHVAPRTSCNRCIVHFRRLSFDGYSQRITYVDFLQVLLKAVLFTAVFGPI